MLIIMNGYSKSGKTTLVDKIRSKFPNTFEAMNSTHIHDFLNTTCASFQDDNSVEGRAYNLRDKATKSIQKALSDVLLSEKVNLIDDSCNSTKEKRTALIQHARKLDPKIKIMIICVEINESVLLERLDSLDNKLSEQNKKKVWRDLYEKIQKPSFQVPEQDEANIVCLYNTDNEAEIYANIEKLL